MIFQHWNPLLEECCGGLPCVCGTQSLAAARRVVHNNRFSQRVWISQGMQMQAQTMQMMRVQNIFHEGEARGLRPALVSLPHWTYYHDFKI